MPDQFALSADQIKALVINIARVLGGDAILEGSRRARNASLLPSKQVVQ
jgi:hypothetical protein